MTSNGPAKPGETSDDDDYMSDAFLASLAKTTDQAPGLLGKRSREYRQINIEKKGKIAKEKNRTKSVKEKEIEAREAKLKTPLDEDNKGFALLKKMGYKPGDTLGKSERGLSEPIGITVRPGTMGLGMEAKLAREEQAKLDEALAKRRRLDNELPSDFRDRMRDERRRKQALKDLLGSQRICEELDRRQGVEESPLWVMEGGSDKDNGDGGDGESEPELDPEAQEERRQQLLEAVTHHLRTVHGYCYWCGAAYEDSERLAESCPGNTREVHDD